MSYAMIILYTTELYNTSIRVTGLGFLNAACRVGGMVMPYLLGYSFNFGSTGPFLAFSILCTLAIYFINKIKIETNDMVLDAPE